MINEQLILNGIQSDMFEGEPTAMTFKANDISNLTTVNSNFSRKFKTPKSRTNKNIIEGAQETQSDSKVPYEDIRAEILVNGLPIVDNGIAKLSGIDQFINWSIFSGNFEFFELLEDRLISDLDLSDHNYIYNLSTAVDLANEITGTCYPIVRNSTLFDSVTSFDIRYQHHAVYVHTIIDKIFEEAGITKAGNVFDDTFYKSLLIPFTNDEFFYSKVIVESSSDVDYDTGVSGEDIIEFDTEDFDQDNEYASNVYTAGEDTEQLFVVRMTITNLTNNINLEFESSNGDLSEKFFIQQSDDPIDVVLRMSQGEFLSGDTLTLKAKAIGGEQDVTFTVKGGAKFYNLIPTNYTADTPNLEFQGRDSTVIVSENLPEMSQKDFVKSVLSLFMTVFTNDSYDKKVSASIFNEITNGHYRAKDWTNKNDKNRIGKINHSINGYGQVNVGRWAEDESVSDSTGFSTFNMNNKNLPKEADIFDLPFAASEMTQFLNVIGVNMAVIELYTPDPESPTVNAVRDLTASPRLLASHAEDLTPSAISFKAPKEGEGIFESTSVFEVVITYFIDETQTTHLGWSSLFETYFLGLINALENVKIVEDFYKLDVNDINELDFTVPIYDGNYNEYFYLLSIDKYQPGKSSKCRLLKI